jgi:hypothetical protein
VFVVRLMAQSECNEGAGLTVVKGLMFGDMVICEQICAGSADSEQADNSASIVPDHKNGCHVEDELKVLIAMKALIIS